MMLSSKQKYLLVLIGMGAFLIGLLTSSVTGYTVGLDNETRENPRKDSLGTRPNNSEQFLNEKMKDLFRCKEQLLEFNLTLKEKKIIIKNKEKILKAKETELGKCKDNLKDHRPLLNISYDIANELEEEGICEDVDKDPESVSKCLENLKENKGFWKIIGNLGDILENLKTLSELTE